MKRRNDETTAHGYAVQNAEIKRANERLAARVMELTRENAELRARLDAVPTADLLFMIDPWTDGTPTPERCAQAAESIEAWAKAIKAVQQPAASDEPDAPLKLAALDEDGDE